MSRQNARRKPVHSMRPVMQRLWGWTLPCAVVLGISGALAAGGWWMNQALTVHAWQIRGVPEALEVAIEKELQASEPLDLVHAWPSLLRARLLARLPDLAEVNIARELPDRLLINATRRMPVALWRNPQGVVLLVDGRALAYRELAAGEMADLPLLRVSSASLERSVAMLLRLRQEDVGRYAQLSEWIEEHDGWRLNFERGNCWLLPEGAAAAPRMQKLIALMRQPRWQKGNWRIDVRADTRWFIRKSKLGGMV